MFAFYLVLGSILMWRLVPVWFEAMPGTAVDHDVVSFVWNLWWTRHALVDLHQSPLVTNAVFAPFTLDLRLHTFSLLHGLVSVPLQPLVGVVGAFNVLTLVTIAANGWAVWRLTGRWLGAHAGRSGPVLAGAYAALAPAALFHLRVGRPSFGSIWVVALAALAWEGVAVRRRPADAVALGACLILAAGLDMQMVLFSATWVAVMALVRWRETVELLRTRAGLTCMALAAFVGAPTALLYAPAFVSSAAHGYALPSDADTLGYSLRYWDFASPTVVSTSLGLVVTASALLGCLVAAKQGWLHGPLAWSATVSLACLVLMLGVALQPTSLPLPFAFLRGLPGLAHFRTPYRFGVPAVVGSSVAAGIAFGRLSAGWSHGRAWALTSVAIGLALVEALWAQPFLAQRYEADPVYERVRQTPGDFVVVDVPLGVRSGIDEFGRGETLQYFHTLHGKRGVNGMVARVPAAVFDYYRSSAAFRFLACDASVPVPSDGALVDDVVARFRELGVGYVLVHTDRLSSSEVERVVSVLDRVPGLRAEVGSDRVRAYRVAP